MIAACYANGKIVFRPRLPRDGLPIASGDAKKLRAAIEPLARRGYDSKTLLVPGIPEANGFAERMAALERFCTAVRQVLAEKAS